MLRTSHDLNPVAKNALLSIGAKNGAYVWLSNMQLPSPSCGFLIFEAKAFNDIHVAFNTEVSKRTVGQDGRADGAPIYEIVIGGWMNSKTAIRRSGMQQAFASRRMEPNSVIDPVGSFCKYWILISPDGLIAVGKGEPNSKKEILRWVDPHPESVHFFGFSSWDTPIQYRNITLVDPKEVQLNHIKNIHHSTALVNSSILHDCIILLPSQLKFYSHRAVLASCSEYFWKIFEEKKNEEVTEIVLEIDLNEKDFLEFLRYCYGGKAHITDSNRKGILLLAEKLNMNDLASEAAVHALTRKKTFYPRLFKNNFLSDGSIVAGGTTFHIHKAVLSLESEHFYVMFKSSFRESSQNEIILEDVGSQTFELFLEFLYTGKASFPDLSEASSVFEIAQRFFTPALSKYCSAYIQENLDVDNCCDLFTFADFLNAAQLYTSAKSWICSNFLKVSKSEAFLTLEPSLLMEIIISDDLDVMEEQLYEILKEWRAANSSKYGNEVYVQLFSSVRYPLIERTLLEKISKDEIMQDQVLQKKVQDSINYIKENEKEENSNSPSPSVRIIEDCIVFEDKFITQPRKGTRFSELLFSHSGDQNGIFYWIATAGKTKRWTNPFKTGLIKITCSSPIGRYTKPDVLVSRSFVTTSFTSGNSPTSSWWSFDLLENALIPNYYSIHMDGGDAYPRSWKLQGSNDGANWVDLKVHKDDMSITHPGQQFAWPISGSNASFAYKMFKLVATGAAANGSNTLHLCGIELYGKLTTQRKTAEKS